MTKVGLASRVKLKHSEADHGSDESRRGTKSRVDRHDRSSGGGCGAGQSLKPLIHKRADAFAAPVARETCYPNSELFRFSSLSVRCQRQRVFSTPGLFRPLAAREVAIREAQSRDRATEAIVIGAL